MEFGTVIDMEEEKMEETKNEQMLGEEVFWMLCAIRSTLASINAIGVGLLALSDDDIRERASDVASKETGNSARYFEKPCRSRRCERGSTMSSDSAWGIEPPKDAEGRVIPLDTEILYETDGQVFHVLSFRYSPKEGDWSVRGGYTGSKNGWCAYTGRLLLAPPDSWDKLIGDLRRAIDSSDYTAECCYLNPEDEDCEKCPARHEQCIKCAFTDIADRIEKLRGSDDH